MKSIVIFILTIVVAILYIKPCAAQEQGPPVSEIEQVKAELLRKVVENQKKQVYKPKWQEDFEAMQLQVNDAMAQDIKLNIEHKILEKEALRLKSEVQDKYERYQKLKKNTDEQREMLDEKKWKAKIASQEQEFQEAIAERNKKLEGYERRIKSLEQKITVARLKLKLKGINDDSDKLLAMQQERDVLEAEIIGQSDKEKILAEKIQKINDENKTLDPAVAGIRSEIDVLRSEIEEKQRKQDAMIGTSGPTPQEQIRILEYQKANLITENDSLKAKIDQYRDSQKMGIENKQIKDLIEAMSAVDTANNELNEEINYLKENIVILKVRVKKLEYQAEALKALKGKVNSVTQKF
jgi:chromosome segregation ATPase